MEIGQKFLMQKENRKIEENEISIHLFEDGYIFSDNLKTTFYKKSLFTKKLSSLVKFTEFFIAATDGSKLPGNINF